MAKNRMKFRSEWAATQLEDLELSVRTANCLQNAGIETVAQLAEKTENELRKIKNFGQKSINEIRQLLASYTDSTVNGYDEEGGLWFSEMVTGSEETMADALRRAFALDNVVMVQINLNFS